jgi:hypothetical protein
MSFSHPTDEREERPMKRLLSRAAVATVAAVAVIAPPSAA